MRFLVLLPLRSTYIHLLDLYPELLRHLLDVAVGVGTALLILRAFLLRQVEHARGPASLLLCLLLFLDAVLVDCAVLLKEEGA